MCDLEECVVGDILHYTTRRRRHSVANEEDHSLLSKEVKKLTKSATQLKKTLTDLKKILTEINKKIEG